jgi:hypothetical protein
MLSRQLSVLQSKMMACKCEWSGVHIGAYKNPGLAFKCGSVDGIQIATFLCFSSKIMHETGQRDVQAVDIAESSSVFLPTSEGFIAVASAFTFSKERKVLLSCVLESIAKYNRCSIFLAHFARTDCRCITIVLQVRNTPKRLLPFNIRMVAKASTRVTVNGKPSGIVTTTLVY